MESDENYFARRAREEYAAAQRSDDPYARRVHLELAERYELRSMSAPPPIPAPVTAGANILPIRPLGT